MKLSARSTAEELAGPKRSEAKTTVTTATQPPRPAAPACQSCSDECLDAADALNERDPKAAKQLALRSCDRAACGYIGRTTLFRCHEYGLPQADPLECQNDCTEECRGEFSANDERPWNACMKSCQEKRGCPDD